MFYLHPVSLISGIIESEKVIYLTLNLGYLIINPSFLDKKDYYRFGSGFGYRNYFPITEVPIFYFQIMPSIHYLEYSKANSGKMINVLGYVGAADNFAFFDVGVGYEWNFVKKKHGLAIDINLALTPLLTLFISILPLALPLALIF